MTGVPRDLAAGLATAYSLERELGRGGMATVFLARDLKHKRPVALKVLHPELSQALGPERFRREIDTAARLQHPHILTVHDSGEAGGRLWYTMPFVEGESLRDRLRRERQLPVDEALRIAREAALALDYAHRHGVIHRDVKPENLLLSADGDTLVADFGIARSLEGADDALTQTGVVIGTPAYMSPEQASGEAALDARSDVYALGSVLYEMLAGEPPFTGPTAQAITAKRFRDPVPSVRRVRSSVPEGVDRALQRALALVPADRFATAAAFEKALAASADRQDTSDAHPRRIGVLVGTAVLLTLALAAIFAWTRRAVPAQEGTKRIAVLPFENLGDSSDAYFADGLTDAIRGKLAAVPGFEVIASTSTSEYRGTAKSPSQIARELGVRYLLLGRVRWDKGGNISRIEVSPELIELALAGAPATRWQQPFSAALTGIFEVQADIATRVASALDVALAAETRSRIAARPTASLEAYDAFLQGQEV
ncbi:MAG TPA: serine/threonine-protein kinase, partial [Gemmatimonadales bacterium]